MNTTKTTNTNTTTHRFYGYTKNAANAKYIQKGAKEHGSISKFLDAVVTTARKEKLKITAPTTSKSTRTRRRVRQ